MWGGKSVIGVDCSGLVQLALNHINFKIPRNTDDQFNFLNKYPSSNLKRGALIFWEGHIAIAIDNNKILHSNAFHMSVEIENLSQAEHRIKKIYGPIRDIKSLEV